MLTVLDAVTRHQVFLEGVKAGQLRDFQRTLGLVARDIRKELFGIGIEQLDALNKAQLARLIKTLQAIAHKHYNTYVAELLAWLQRFTRVNRKQLISIYEPFAEPARVEALSDDDYPAAPLLYTKAKNAPLPANGILMHLFIGALTSAGTNAILNRVRQGWANRETVSQVVAAVVGTQAARLNDGIIARQGNLGRAAISTAVQHIDAITAEAVGRMLFREYEWHSVIDSATTDICRSRNGNRYRFGSGPLPPAHAGCRSSVVPVPPNAPPKRPAGFRTWAMAQPGSLRRAMFGGDDPGQHFAGSPPLTLQEYEATTPIVLTDA